MSISNAVEELYSYYTTNKPRSRTGKALQTSSVEFDWNSSGRMLTSDVKQQGRKKEFEEKENESLMLKQLSSFKNVSHIAKGKSSSGSAMQKSNRFIAVTGPLKWLGRVMKSILIKIY